jgi:hypothetical protein
MTKLVRTKRGVKRPTGRLENTNIQRFFRYTVYIYSLLCEHILFIHDRLSCDDTYVY